MVFSMLKFNLVLALLFVNISAYAEDVINESCTSKSGASIFDISLNTSQGVGEVRYRYFEQDVFYSAKITSIEGSVIKGVAEFKESRSGEVRGTSWIFTYDGQKKILWDNEFPTYCK
jgi:hypothetical protein